MNTFHYQTDGWFSQRSAQVYETSTETLFVGRQDAMQRQALVPLSGFMSDRAVKGRGTTMLEVACGTGRLATFVKVGVDGPVRLPVLRKAGRAVCFAPNEVRTDSVRSRSDGVRFHV